MLRQAAANFFLRLGLRIQGVPYKPARPDVRGMFEPGLGRPATSTTPQPSTTLPKPPPPPQSGAGHIITQAQIDSVGITKW